MWRVVGGLVIVGVLGCRQSNPDWLGPAGGSSTGMTSATSTGDGADDTTSTTAAGESSDGGSEGSGDSGLGLPCGEVDECSQAPGAECCTAEQCTGACMVPCEVVTECPSDTMGCHHGYCLFPCMSDDDCSAWPNFTCQHDGQFCELD